MTAILRPIVRATGLFQRGEEIVVELQRGFLVARLKGRPSSRHAIGYGELYEVLAWRDARAAAAEKVKVKKGKRR